MKNITLVNITIFFMVSGLIFDVVYVVSDFIYYIISSIAYVICYYLARQNAKLDFLYYFWFYTPTIALVIMPAIFSYFDEKSSAEQIWQIILFAWPLIPILLLLKIRSNL
jgi:hypothetical protein